MNRLLQRFKIATKLHFISAAYVLPLAVLLCLLVRNTNANLDFVKLELRGTDYLRPLEDLLYLLPQHSVVTCQVLGGDKAAASQLPALQSQIDQAVAAFEAIDAKHGVALQFTPEGLAKRKRSHVNAKDTSGDWQQMKAGWSALTPKVCAEKHAHMVEDMRVLIAHAADTSNLTLDPDLDSYYMMDVVVGALPQAMDRIGVVQPFCVNALGENKVGDEERSKVSGFVALMREADVDRTKNNAGTAVMEDSNFYGTSASLQSRVPPAVRDFGAAADAFIALVQELAVPSTNKVEAASYVAAGQKMREAAHALWKTSVVELDGLLNTRLAHFQHQRIVMIGLTAASLAIALVLVYFIRRTISQPLIRVSEAVTAVSTGDLTVSVAAESRDETGQIASSVNQMVTRLRENIQTTNRNAQAVAAASEELSATSTQVSTNSEVTSAQVQTVSTSAEQVSRNIQTVAASSEEMSATIGEIAKNAAQASQVAMQAATVAERTNQTVSKLGSSSAEIGNVIKVITSIAEQTNLLALNATIEAARAGEAGKGFAVVANEVKELAKQTAKATEEISGKIAAIQSDTEGAVAAIQEIGGIIKQINEIQTVIAGAVEEQAATTREMSRNVQEAATGSAEIARNINSVADAARSTTQGATQTASAASELARLSAELKSVVDQFRLEGAPERPQSNASLPTPPPRRQVTPASEFTSKFAP